MLQYFLVILSSYPYDLQSVHLHILPIWHNKDIQVAAIVVLTDSAILQGEIVPVDPECIQASSRHASFPYRHAPRCAYSNIHAELCLQVLSPSHFSAYILNFPVSSSNRLYSGCRYRGSDIIGVNPSVSFLCWSSYRWVKVNGWNCPRTLWLWTTVADIFVCLLLPTINLGIIFLNGSSTLAFCIFHNYPLICA